MEKIKVTTFYQEYPEAIEDISDDTIPTGKINFISGVVETFDSLSDVARLITQTCWSPATFIDNYRNADNFLSTQLLTYDVDSGMTIDNAMDILSDYKHIIATTKSHQKIKKNKPAIDRFRIILMLDKPITDKKVFKKVWINFLEKSGISADISAKDSSRFYFYSKEVFSINEEGISVNVDGYNSDIFTPTSKKRIMKGAPTEPISDIARVRQTIEDLKKYGDGLFEENFDFFKIMAAFKAEGLNYSDIDPILQNSLGYDYQGNLKRWSNIDTNNITFGSAIYYAEQVIPQHVKDKRKSDYTLARKEELETITKKIDEERIENNEELEADDVKYSIDLCIKKLCIDREWMSNSGKVVRFRNFNNTFETINLNLIHRLVAELLEGKIPPANIIYGSVLRILENLGLEFNRLKTIYEPGGKKYHIKDEKFYINHWWNFKIKEGTLDQVEKVLNIFNNINDKEERDWVLQTLAHKIVHPYTKGRLIVFYSKKEGTGKTSLTKSISMILGGGQELSEEAIHARFNNWVLNPSLIVSCSEYYFSRKKINTLKDMITNSTVMVEQKGREILQAQNFSYFIFNSNDINELQLTSSTSRMSIIQSFEKKFRGMPDDIDEIERTLTESDLSAFRHYLINEVHDESKFKLQFDKNVEELIDNNMPSYIEDGIEKLNYDIISSANGLYARENGFFISNKYINSIYSGLVKKSTENKNYNVMPSERVFKQEFSDYLNREGKVETGKKPISVNGKSVRGFFYIKNSDYSITETNEGDTKVIEVRFNKDKE